MHPYFNYPPTLQNSLAKKCVTRRQRGMSLVELMVAMALGLLISSVMLAIFINNHRTQQEILKTNQQIENGRYATDLLLADARLAGYYGEFNPADLDISPTDPPPDPTNLDNLSTDIALPIQGYDNGTGMRAALTTLLADLRAGTDVLVLRRTSSCIAGTAGCDAVDMTRNTYFQTALCQKQISSLDPAKLFLIGRTTAEFTTTNPAVTAKEAANPPAFLAGRDCVTPAVLRTYKTHIYFVSNNHNAGDGIPTLNRAELGAETFTLTPLVEGIDQLQFEYGHDTNNDGAPESYVTNLTTAAEWRQVTAIKIHLIARNKQITAGFVDNRTYTLGANVFGPYNDAYKRHAYTTVVRLNNIAGRLE